MIMDLQFFFLMYSQLISIHGVYVELRQNCISFEQFFRRASRKKLSKTDKIVNPPHTT